ncbi:MAG: Smt3-specific protease [Alectoria sarmentosa]|nr:MAG: Smt3-specific protease [Alectoria sarmentosa]
MDSSLGSDGMDWEEDSSLHIIQPASSPWRKRSFDTYNDTIEPYRANEGYSGYRVTDTIRHHPDLVEPFIDFNGRPARYVTDFDGNVILQPIIQRQPRKPIGYYLPEWVKWIIYGAALLVISSCSLAGDAYIRTATVAVRVGSSAKRRLVEVTTKTFAPAPPPRRHRHNVPPHRRRSPIIRRVSPILPGGRTHIPVTPPRARPTATLNEAAVTGHECIVDYVPSNNEHLRHGAFVTTSADDHLVPRVTHHPYFEPLMSGALQDKEMDKDTHSDVTPPFSPYYIPGTFPDSLASPRLPSTESSTSDSQVSDGLSISYDRATDESATSDKEAADEMALTCSEASDEPDTPDVQPAIKFPLQEVDSRPRNYKGELLDDWQIKLCREFQAIHPPPREIRRQATIEPEQQRPISIGLIELHQSPTANVSPGRAASVTIDLHEPITGLPRQPHGITSIGSNDLHRSPLDLHRVTVEALHQPHGKTSLGSNDLHRSPLGLPTATTKVLHQPHGTFSSGLNDSHRSPLGLPTATTKVLHRPHGTTSLGLNDLYRSPSAAVSPMRAGDALIESHDANISSSRPLPGTAPLADVSPANSPHGTNSIGSIDSPRSPFDVYPNHLQPGKSPTGSIDSPRSPLAESPMGAVFDTMIDTHEDGPYVSGHTLGATPVPFRSPLTSPSAVMTSTPAESPLKWSIRSLYMCVKGKPKKRSPLCERIDNANIHKVPKTPKKVSWPQKGPVTGTKRFIKHEAMSHPSPSSSREDSSILSSVPSEFSPQSSPTMHEEEEEAELNPSYQVYSPKPVDDDWSTSPTSSNKSGMFHPMSTIAHSGTIHNSDEEKNISSSSSSANEASSLSVGTPTKIVAADPSTPPSLSPKFEELTISTRRSSLRRREKEDQAQKVRDAIAAEEKARKDKEQAEEKARKEKEEAEERARIKAEKEEERKKTGGRRIPIERVIQSLPPGWDEKVRINMAKGMREQLALTSVGNPLTRRDFGMVLPQPGTGDDPSGWLNDEIISGYLQAVVDHGHQAMGHPRGAKPRMHAFNPFFYTTLKERGYEAVKRWSTRAKIGGNDLKTVEYVFIPCNPSKNHWTLVVVSPVRKTIEVFDSMHGASLDKVNTTKLWLRGELGRSYVDSEWTVIEDPVFRGRGKGPTQNNVNDCGVFAVTTAKMLVLGVDPMAVSAGDMPLQRRRLVAELLNGGFSGDFEPRVVFE